MNPKHNFTSRSRRTFAVGLVAAALAACGGSDDTALPPDATDAQSSSTTAAPSPGSDSTAPLDSGVTAVCFPGGVVPSELSSTTDFFSSSGCTVTVADPGEAFWLGQGYHAVEAPPVRWVNDDLRCAVNGGMPGVEAGTTVWNVLCGNAFPADLDDSATATKQTTTTTEPAGDQLAAQLWPADLPLPPDFIFQGVQEYPDRGFSDFTLEYTGDGFAEESFWIWASEHLDNVDPADPTGGQAMTYQGRHVEVAQMGDTLFRFILGD